MRALLLLPTYNEAENIQRLLEKVAEVKRTHQLDLDILVMDDSSPDGTGEIVADYAKKNSDVKLLRRPGKLGLGSAYRQGFGYAIEHGYDAAIQMDCDFSHDPKELPNFVNGLRDHDVVVGSRYITGGSIPNWNIFRRFLSGGGNLYSRVLLGVPLHDLTGGFNAYTTTALKALTYQNVATNGYAFQIEMKYRAHKKRLRFKEIPIVFIDREYGVSKIPASTAPAALWRVFRWRFQKFE